MRRNRSYIKWILGAGLVVSQANAQVPTYPAIQTDVGHDGTATGAAVKVLNDGATNPGYRIDCVLQNNGTHNMFYVFGGGVATSGSRVLLPGNLMYCSNGITISSQALSLLGTSGDKYSLTESFLRSQ